MKRFQQAQLTPIETLDVSNIIIFNLKKEDIYYVDDLFRLSKKEILKINEIGKKRFEEIITALQKLNLDTNKFTKEKKKAEYPYNIIEDIYGQNIILSKYAFKNLEQLISYLSNKLQEYITYHYKQNLSYNQCAVKLNVTKGAIQKHNKELKEFFLLDSIKKYILDDVQLDITNPTSAEMVLSYPTIKAGFEFSLTKVLIKNGYETIGDIVREHKKIKDIKGIGEIRYQSLLDRLVMFGIYLS